ncbi:hypothetical protein BDQ17DRAFT_1247740 [Cyathus striatus]|nr:hypothetical protein BDQ17DRAFT_1247740 [Cyathus striatus]
MHTVFPLLNSTTGQPAPPCDCNQRTRLDILWSCVSTLFLATWVSVHPNIPDPDEENWKIFWRRLKLMYWAVVAPELVFTFAVRQYMGARSLRKLYQGSGYNWTMKHAHFLQMGGFYMHSKEYNGVLHPNIFWRFVDQGNITFPEVTEADIQDRSKADALTKTIVMMQIIWFIMQCIARLARGYALAPLEVTTLAVTVCTFMLSIIWWHKPFNVRQPIYVKYFSHTSKEEGLNNFNDVNKEGSHQVPKRIVINEYRVASPTHMEVSTNDGLNYPSNTEVPAPHTSTSRCGIVWRHIQPFLHPLKMLYLSLQSITSILYITLARSIRDYGLFITIFCVTFYWPVQNQTAKFLGLDTKVGHDRRRVRTYFAWYKWSDRVLFIPIPCATMLGIVHCILWGSHFPTRTEMILWRISAVVLSTTPLCMAGVEAVVRQIWCSKTILDVDFDAVAHKSLSYNIFVGTFYFILFGGVLLARLYLIVEGLLSLRELAPSALVSIDWSDFIPHF